MKNRLCEEVVEDKEHKRTYKFAGTFGFVQMLALNGRDPSFIFNDLSEERLPPDDIKNVLMYSLEEIDGNPIKDSEREPAAIEFIERAGLLDASFLARILITHAIIGTIKKKHILTAEAVKGAIFKSKHSRWKIFAVLGLSLVGISMASAAVVCTIFKL